MIRQEYNGKQLQLIVKKYCSVAGVVCYVLASFGSLTYSYADMGVSECHNVLQNQQHFSLQIVTAQMEGTKISCDIVQHWHTRALLPSSS
jgi:hypothetical protein